LDGRTDEDMTVQKDEKIGILVKQNKATGI
jgi:hypothetical protein